MMGDGRGGGVRRHPPAASTTTWRPRTWAWRWSSSAKRREWAPSKVASNVYPEEPAKRRSTCSARTGTVKIGALRPTTSTCGTSPTGRDDGRSRTRDSRSRLPTCTERPHAAVCRHGRGHLGRTQRRLRGRCGGAQRAWRWSSPSTRARRPESRWRCPSVISQAPIWRVNSSGRRVRARKLLCR